MKTCTITQLSSFLFAGCMMIGCGGEIGDFATEPEYLAQGVGSAANEGKWCLQLLRSSCGDGTGLKCDDARISNVRFAVNWRNGEDEQLRRSVSQGIETPPRGQIFYSNEGQGTQWTNAYLVCGSLDDLQTLGHRKEPYHAVIFFDYFEDDGFFTFGDDKGTSLIVMSDYFRQASMNSDGASYTEVEGITTYGVPDRLFFEVTLQLIKVEN